MFEHFAAVRAMFEQSELFVFTVGLTGGVDGKGPTEPCSPVAPGVVSDAVNRNDYGFVNFRTSEIVADLNEFIRKLKSVNPAKSTA